jgi:hypothetical protein
MANSDDSDDIILPLGMVDSEAGGFALSGRVADGWAMFEFHLDRTLWRIAAVNDAAGACITAQMLSVHGRLRALRSLVALAGGTRHLIKEINKIAAASEGLAEQRNRLVHDPWMMNVTKRTVGKMRITARGKLDFRYVPVTDTEVSAVLKNIDAHTKRFFEFERRLWAELGPLLETQEPPPPQKPSDQPK